METKFTVKDFMSKELISFQPDTQMEFAISNLLENKISGAPVVDNSGALVGMLSEKDCLSTLFESTYYNNPSGHVSDYMTTELITVDCDMSLADVAKKFMETRFRRYPVIQDGKLVGQISRRDILRAINQQLKQV
ncbi:MAG: CBS domain-containing protein [Candidatus Marinimicrobia bacterium]|jgi:predicted transcriptional regulator|nr:CBS domain-containing protein [Candidatus Neomarinimicrobiota bacterium]MBT3936419.1 CBS domain-containing protein [Candidatus Neomarinimicrobiota bacterium]MBT3960372.1 CBS domain-containing protein [Candidatus Neomarinimicrobiota bacterium]MBT4383460.1 CBS domain-containing protein [Candidatus Neomarinimicrobiota bacterium]MBT4635472.1 CBS domain-containing protein [Candidatus Neomarinimicrobiota bacterium]